MPTPNIPTPGVPVSLNPLAPQPPNTSPRFSLNSVDWAKIFRFMLVQTVGLFLSLGVPHLLNFSYVFNGMDYTPYVVFIVNGLAEAARRLLSSQPK